MSIHPRIRYATDLITFFNPGYWGLDPDLSHQEWTAAFAAAPRRFFDSMLDSVRDCGLEGVEIAPEPGGWTRALDAYGSTQGVGDALSQRGLVLASSYSPRSLFQDAIADPSRRAESDATIARHAEFVRTLGGSIIVTGSLPRTPLGAGVQDDTATPEQYSAPVPRDQLEIFADHLNRLGAVAGGFGVRLAIHTDGYSMTSRAEDIDTILSLTDPETVQLCLDAGHIAIDGGDPVAILAKHTDRIPLMHWKDCVGPLEGSTLRGDRKERHAIMLKSFRILGSGTIDWEAWMRVLRDANWSGWAIQEIDMSPDPEGEMRTGLEYFVRHLAPLYPVP